MSDPARNLNDEAALRLIVEGTVSETGTEFFRALVRNLATVMNTTGAWVTEYLREADRLRAHAFWLNGSFLEHYEHGVANTPCAAVLQERRLVLYADRILDIYPDNPDLQQLGAVSYMGVPLFDTAGEVMGHLAVLDTKPLPSEPRLKSLFEIFAARAAAECRRLKAEQLVRAREEQLSSLLDSAMDAVVALDAAGKMVQANPAAERLFGCTAEDLLGENLRGFLAAESATHFDAFVKELDAQPASRRQLWIPQSFTVLRWDHSTFPAEATLSRFESRGQVFHTLILRNVDERVEAARRIESLTSQAEYLQAELRALHNFDEIIGQSAALRRVLHDVAQVAVTDAAVLIQGETGTGKELFARAVHAASRRRDKPLVTVNCAAVPATLIESEFFGHERGAFTGATTKREGRFSLADGGTIFLDEIGELPFELQSKLLRVLQEGTFEAVGGSVTRKVNVRVIAATNRDLGREANEGRFRQDLFYRLNVFPLQLPPLRDRPEDIPALAGSFAHHFAQRIGRALEPIAPESVRRLQSYSWPGNVRELRNVIERAVITAVAGKLNLDRALPDIAPAPRDSEPASAEDAPRIRTLQELEALERENLRRALDAAQWRVSGKQGAAELLRMNASTLRSRMKALGIEPPD